MAMVLAAAAVVIIAALAAGAAIYCAGKYQDKERH